MPPQPLTPGQQKKWFMLKLVMGYTSILLLAGIMVVCTVILLNPNGYPEYLVKGAMGALFVEILALLATVWKVVFQ